MTRNDLRESTSPAVEVTIMDPLAFPVFDPNGVTANSPKSLWRDFASDNRETQFCGTGLQGTSHAYTDVCN